MPQIIQGFDDVAPATGVLNYGDYTNDTAPVIRVGFTGEDVAGDTIRITDNGATTLASVTLSAADVSTGYVDVPVSGLVPEWNLLTASSVAADGTVKATSVQWALGLATATPPAPGIVSATDDVGAHTGPIAAGSQTDDATPTLQLFEQGLPPIPTTSPGHAPYGGPALLSGTMRLYDGTILVATGQIGFGGEVSLTSSALSPGQHTLTAVAVDRAGNVSPPSAPFVLTVGPDATEPTTPASTQPTPGGDLLDADASHTTIVGGPGDDTLTGWSGGDRLHGGEGADVINGGSGFDGENGNGGNDTVHGGAGDDWVVGGKDQDVLFGDDGADIVNGNIGADTCDGGAGNDVIRGGQDNDVLRGGEGDDWLSGDRGDDTLTGGAGADSFHIFPGGGSDVVTDFSQAEGDRVVVDGGGNYATSQQGADVLIAFQSGGEMVLQNVQLSTLTPGWIVAA